MDITDMRGELRCTMQETAALARLNMSEQELQELFPAFEQIVSFFDSMQVADNDEAVISASSSSIAEDLIASARIVSSDYFRPDTAAPLFGEDMTEKMLAKAGERDGRFVVIPNVL